MNSKKGIYFTIEAIIAMMVISVGFTILLYLFVALSQPPISSVQTGLYDVVEELDLEIRDIGSSEDDACSAKGELVENDIIIDTDNGFFTQMGEFYYCMNSDNCVCDSDCESEYEEYIGTCMEFFISKRNLDEKNLYLQIEDTVLYRSDADSTDNVIYISGDEDGNLDQENATVLFPFRIILIGVYNGTNTWGPYTGEVRIWE
ncbi:hypothetical protein COV16_02495 [Candidatus Woesearchaeota archaeon CG10_big_fil_rev_8_21_14_0_10_34_8]|nr:MAG: hypothetical protein COV16_02495 [Candidatus Woesearchaeota archaeon CG10_big_fil_rev_8_21_14_0_10_34_8]